MIDIIQEVEGFYRIIPLLSFRRTPGVSFDKVPMQELPWISFAVGPNYTKPALELHLEWSQAKGFCTK